MYFYTRVKPIYVSHPETLRMYAYTMSDMAERIRQRLRELGTNANAASMRATGSPSTIQNILLGRSANPRADTIARIADALDCRPEWLLTGNGPIQDRAELRHADDVAAPRAGDSPRDIPVMGTVAGSELGQGAFQLTPDVIEYVRRPAGLATARDIYALYVEGESMSPKFEPGELVYVNPHRKPLPGDYVVVQEPDSNNGEPRAFIKKLVRVTGTKVHTVQFNPPTTIDFVVRPGLRIHKVMLSNDLYGV